MRQKILIYLIAILSISVIITTNSFSKNNTVCFDSHCFEVELAITQTERSNGLMYRNHLDQNKGMLFIFPNEDNHSFWMKNTLIALDVIWVNKKKEVVFINKNSRPCTNNSCFTIEPNTPAKYVLEINANTCDKIGLKVGDKLDFSFCL